MIRIEEIYSNVFLPKLQSNRSALHWFDPFGSVDFFDLCSAPVVKNSPNITRYVFWDQEPLHKDLFDSFAEQYLGQFYKGPRHLVVSELNSDTVQLLSDTYKFKTHYYFFHGWAALDWFRGYNRSFVMPDPVDRTVSTTFISPNRIVAGQRQHRLLMLYHIFKNQLSNNWISCPLICPGEQVSIHDAAAALSSVYPDITQVFAAAPLPINFPSESGNPMHSYQLSLFDQCADSLLYLVTETVGTGRRHHLTEKIFKPICLRMPFVLVSTAGSLEYLRSYGFQTFSSLWDESYDNETDDVNRVERVGILLQQLDRLSLHEKQQLHHHAQKITQHNFEHFYGGNFEHILWNELVNTLEDMSV